MGLEAARGEYDVCETLNGHDGTMASLFVATTPGEQSNELHRIAHAAWLATRENRHAPWLTWMTWTTESFSDLVKIAFTGKMINDYDHPVLKGLRGEL